MDALTLAYYARHANDVAQRYEAVPSPLAAHFGRVWAPGARVLDIGCGSGRDLAELLRQGFDAYGMDGTPEMVACAQQLHPALQDRVVCGELPGAEPPFGGHFDAVLCCAVLMHLPSTHLPPAAQLIRRCLRPGGRLLLSVPSQRDDALADQRDEHGRLFHTPATAGWQAVFEAAGFHCLEQWGNADSLQRPGIAWVTQLWALA